MRRNGCYLFLLYYIQELAEHLCFESFFSYYFGKANISFYHLKKTELDIALNTKTAKYPRPKTWAGDKVGCKVKV